MRLQFCKYHGTGNDFILIDNRNDEVALSQQQISHLCHRRFGIGADGLMLLEKEEGADFRMVYYNSDGGESTMCGNGGRCIVAFAQRLNIIEHIASFIAIDGSHNATIDANNIINLEMQDVNAILHGTGHSVLNTGSPHYIVWVGDAEHSPVVEEGRRIRNEGQFAPNGINVNFVEIVSNGHLRVRTYERGVEDETMSCGTGVVASAIAASGPKMGDFVYQIETPGGTLSVSFQKPEADSAQKVVLMGPASFVFEGIIDL